MLSMLAACAGGASPGSGGFQAVSDSPVKIGGPYTVRGATYLPADDPHYDEVGYASWYGREHEGEPTARGEPFRPAAISAAHRTLPLPSYVEVTALETGRTILVRINDRGPFLPSRIIDLSEGAANQLGVRAAGVAPVWVHRVEPQEHEREALRSGRAALERKTISGRALHRLRERLTTGSRTSQKIMQPVIRSGYLVRVASFSSQADAAGLAARLGGSMQTAASGYYQVTLGPYPSDSDAREGVEAARRAGYSDARILEP